jgi:hypothetical protein
MKIISDDKEAELKRLKFEESLGVDPITEKGEYTSFEINWVDWIKTYEEAKNKTTQILSEEIDERLVFLASDKDKIYGKPQLIHENIQRIPLLRETLKIQRKKGEDDQYIKRMIFIDDPYDKRYDGKTIATLAFDFFLYRVVDSGKEYYIFSGNKLPNEYCEFEGMKINLDDVSDISANLKVKKISSVFICHNANPSVKIISPEELIEFTKEKEITVDKFHDTLFLHPDGNIYDYTPDFNLLRKAQLLSSKYEGYPLHMMKMGPVGTGKTTEAEVLNYKFNEDQGILEAANSTLKVLVPSFKEKPANMGYICKCNRMSIIDEMMKMVESAMGHDSSRISNYFGQMNMLLEQKDRMVGSGNDNSTRIKSTSKISITTNNMVGKDKIARHLGVVDPTTLSRMIVWVQDYAEIEKIYNKEGVKESPPHNGYPESFFAQGISYISDSRDGDSVGGNFNDFLTIYDSCQQFIVNFDKDRCKKLYNVITSLSKEPMRQVWRSRGLHHTILLLDGIVKHRCLFKDYDNTYSPKDCDYDDLERLLIHMVNTWETNFNHDSWKETINDTN